MFRKHPPPDFLDWLRRNTSLGAASRLVHLNRKSDANQIRGLHVEISDENERSRMPSLKIDAGFSNNAELYDKVSRVLGFEQKHIPAELSSVTVPLMENSTLIVRNAKMHTLFLIGKPSGTLDVRDCWIGRLRSQVQNANLVIRRTNIGCLRFTQNMIKDLRMENVWVISLSCPEPGSQGPFSGNIIIGKTAGPRSWKDTHLEKDEVAVQQWTNVRCHLANMSNFRAASVFHASELSLERENEPWGITRTVGWIYENLSDYGNSIGRSLGWLGALWLFLMLAYWALGGTVASPEIERYADWRGAFVGAEWYNDLARAGWLASQPIVAPLGGVTGRTPVEPANFGWYCVNAIHRIVSAVLIFLTLLSIRRRFRMSSA